MTMQLKPETIKTLQREHKLATLAITRLQDRCHSFEQQYGLDNNDFMGQFNDGQIGDDLDFFRWYAYLEAVKDWETTQRSLKELLVSSESVHVA